MIKQLLIIGIFPGIMALAALTDLFFMRVPNSLVFVLAAGFFIVAPLVGLGLSDIGIHVCDGARGACFVPVTVSPSAGSAGGM